MMLRKLQRKTLPKVQVIGYALTLFIGTVIILISVQFYLDIQPLLMEETDLFSKNAAVISKQVSINNAFDEKNVVRKSSIYFTNEEIEELKDQDFIKKIAKFENARFEIEIELDDNRISGLTTELFFESIPDEYLDLQPKSWNWDPSDNYIPIIIPEDYLNLYNFGYAQSKGLPVISKLIATNVNLNIWIEGRNKAFSGNIVGFSNKINSILVPEDFLNWANAKFGTPQPETTTRLLIEFTDPTDKDIIAFFNEKNYSINEDKLELSKLIYIFKSAFAFVLFVAIIIVILSFAFILLSINLIFEKHRDTIVNLYNIGYSNRQIARFYQFFISIVTGIILIGAMLTGLSTRLFYQQTLISSFMADTSKNWMILMGVVMAVTLLFTYNILVMKSVKRISNPAN